jgi:hypothetical protein
MQDTLGLSHLQKLCIIVWLRETRPHLWEKIKGNLRKHSKCISRLASQDPLLCRRGPTLNLLLLESSMKMSLWRLIIRRMAHHKSLRAHLTRRVILSRRHSFRCLHLMSRIGCWGISWTIMKIDIVLLLSIIQETKRISTWFSSVLVVTQLGDSESMTTKWCSSQLPHLKLLGLKTRIMQMKIFLQVVQSKRAAEGNLMIIDFSRSGRLISIWYQHCKAIIQALVLPPFQLRDSTIFRQTEELTRINLS